MKRITIILVSILALLIFASLAFAQGYDLSWWTVDGGGGTSTGGNYTLSGTIGQPDAGPMTGGDYAVSGGFWTGFSSSSRQVYLPFIVKGR